ncbi:unnamed protein product [Gulo gulo]|uniref:Immunoglobulin V-set domain-containing protein n=1 Tax=Gulo gulo TaxID=48420 RepID=A0A9X9PZ08_GULGU|nr:unnamed protein product [Gulo gulo]
MLLSQCTRSPSQPVLTQPHSRSASLGATTILTSTLTSGFSVGSYYINWYKQKPGSPPQCLLYYILDSDKHQGSLVSVSSLDPKMSQPMQGSCSFLGCNLRISLTIIVLQLMAMGAATILTVSQITRK